MSHRLRSLARSLAFSGFAVALLVFPALSGLAQQPAPSSAPSRVPTRYEYPSAPRGDVVEDYHGTKVADPYRSLENPDDPTTVAWVDSENRLTRSLLDRPEREGIKARLTELFDYPKIGIPEKKGGRYFFFKNAGLQNQSVYYVQEGPNGEPRVLIDPNTMSPDGTVALTNTSPSKDGRLLGYAVSKSGSDRQEIFVRDVATGKDLPDKLVWVKFSGISWTPDGKGFFYTRYPEPGTVPSGDEHYFPKFYYHRLGEAQERDSMFFEKPTEKEVGVGGFVSWDGRWLVILPGKGASDKTEVWALDLKKPGARPFAVFTGFDSAYQVAEVMNGKLYARTDRDAPLGRIISVDLTTLSSNNKDAPFKEIVSQGTDTIQAAYILNAKLVVRRLRSASTALEVRDLTGKLEREIRLPEIGSVAAISGEVDDREMFFSFSSFTMPSTNYRYDLRRRQLVLFSQPHVKVDPSLYETEQVWYPSKDGTKVSMFLVHRKGLKKDGNRPVYLSAYGGFNISSTPGFSATRYVFLEKDGVVAIPNLRGGGEYGEEWHRAGMREKKQNVFDDFISAAEWLIANGWTKASRLAIQGGSNGGLLVSAVEMQRPDLYGAVICQVPVADMLRYQKFTVGRYWISEYGSSEQAADFPFLYKYSPYHNVREGVSYPATLVTTADTDDRVAPGHGKKLAARLQAAQAGDEHILLRVETKAGHGAGKPTTKILDEQADIYTFLFWQLGMT
ncbi:MAG TPA: prolyl oligopeptidase family serine peptidase [Thermoanaerobaculia bacterium]|nr:prolyl oligopeptidase family serine peptidase [Thermoanaerobaculia bacterium]